MAATFNLGQAVLGTEVDLKGLNKGLDEAESNSQNAVQRMVTGFGDNMQIIGGMAVAGGIALAGALTTGAVKAVQTFVDFQHGMAEVFTLLPGISQDAMDQMSDQVLGLSKDMGVLPESVIPALYQALSAGVPPDNVFEFLETAQKAAVGGVTDLETAVDGTSSVVNAYGKDVISAAQASDYMFTAVRLGKTTFEELSGSLFNVTPVAAGLGVSFDQVTAALAAMTGQGVPTSVATTQLRQLLVELSKSGSQAADTFTDLAGVSFTEFIAKGGNVQDALKIMEAGAAEAGVPISDLFGAVEAGNAALALTGKGTETFTNNLNQMALASGATDQAFETMDQSLGRSWQRIQATFESTLIKIGGAFQPLLDDMAEFVEGHADEVVAFIENDLIPGIRGLIGVLDLFFKRDFTGDFGKFFGLMEDDPLVGTLFDLRDGFFQVMDVIGKFLGDNFKIGDLLAGLGIAISTVVIPLIIDLVASFAPVIATFAAVVAGIALVRQAWESDFLGIRTAVTEFWTNSVQPAFEEIQRWFETILPPIVEHFQELWIKLQPAFQELGRVITEELLPLFADLFPNSSLELTDILDGLTVGISLLIGMIDLAVEGFIFAVEHIQDVIDWIKRAKANVEETAAVIGTAFNNAWQAVIDFWNNTVRPPFDAMFNFFNGTLIPLFRSVGNVIDAVVGLAFRVLVGIVQTYVLPALNAVWSFISTYVLPVLRLVGGYVQIQLAAAFNTLSGIWNNTVLPALRAIHGFIDANILPIFRTVESTVRTNVGGALMWLNDHVMTPFKLALGKIDDVLRGLTGTLNSFASGLNNLSLPSWLTPGSPTPFEMGLKGINKEMDKLTTTALPDMGAGLNLQFAGAGGALGGEKSVTNEFNFHGVVFPGDEREAEDGAYLITNAMRGRGEDV